jgi:hypothetical protein
MILIFDHQVQGKCYPNLVTPGIKPYTPDWHQFSQRSPYSEPSMLVEYLQREGVDVEIRTVDQSTPDSYYVIAISFFDFSTQWFNLLSAELLDRLRRRQIRLLFWYSEGDNPQRMRDHLDAQAQDAGVDPNQVWIVSANSAADDVANTVWFADDEMLYRHRNRRIIADPIHDNPRTKKFTALVRTHKWWRATIMANMWRNGWHTDALFAYNTAISVGEPPDENPIEIDRFDGLRSSMDQFLSLGPFVADSLTSDEHNNHTFHTPKHYRESYFNVIIETHMDADQSNGVFLTEKTFKPIKHGVPFLMFGCTDSLAKLRSLGYATFDDQLDQTYDIESNTTNRYARAMTSLETIATASLTDLHNLYQRCKPACLHNQQLFLASKKERLNMLLEKLCK